MAETRAIGDNRSAADRFDDARRQNLATSILLLCKEALITAIQDRRLDRGQLKVLATIATCINGKNAMAWPDRATIAAMTGLSLKSVSNTLAELKDLGYLIADRRAVEEAGGKRLMCFTFGNIDHDTIRRHITEVMLQIRAGRDGKSPPDGNFPLQGELAVPLAGGTSPSGGNNPGPEFPSQGEKSSPPGGRSNTYKEQDSHRHAYGHEQGTVLRQHEHGAPKDAQPLGHGAFINAEIIWHPKFTISLASARQQFKLTADTAALDVDAICKAAATQWSAEIEGGKPAREVVPSNIIGALLASARRGVYAAHEHQVRLANARTSGSRSSKGIFRT
jgi:hypothetical protein